MESKSGRKRMTSKMPEIIEDISQTEESFVGAIKTDWNLFWHGIVGDQENTEQQVPSHAAIEALTLEQIKKITKSLSQDRKILNQRIEEVNKELELNSEKIESLKLVGGELEETVEHINRLNDIGQQLTTQLGKLNDQLKFFRHREDILKSEKNSSKD